MSWIICDQCNQGTIRFKWLSRFTIWGTPVQRSRVRARAMVSKTGKVFATVYNPDSGKHSGKLSVSAWKKSVFVSSRVMAPGEPLTGPVYLSIDFYFPRPKYMTAKKYGEGAVPHAATPDRDNLEKAVLDSLQGRYFKNDSQVCAGHVRKFYVEIDGKPRAEVTAGVLETEKTGGFGIYEKQPGHFRGTVKSAVGAQARRKGVSIH